MLFKMITLCNNTAKFHGNGAYDVITSITSHTSIKQFDFIVSNAHTQYTLENGGRCGWTALGMAATKGNISLVYHIVKIGGPQLLNLGNTFGHTPLYCSISCQDTTLRRQTVDP